MVGDGLREEQSLGELFSQLAQETRTLLHQEVELAKTEMSQKAAQTREGAVLLGAGGALAYVGLFAIVAGIIALLALFLPLWLSALIVGAVIALIGLILIRQGASRLENLDLAPKKTIRTLREDVAFLQQEVT